MSESIEIQLELCVDKWLDITLAKIDNQLHDDKKQNQFQHNW